ncbi:hypothetical protein RND81_12G235000 [Saponaria officinalis]|uniref:Uncharacterized protein n=1 Tax=Saponaria officinalis TaxID=3572 RepID=A0AAW1HEM9_SAPOF
MIIKWEKEYLDLILVPSGLLIMFGYHIRLLYKYLRFPQSTVLGFENHCKIAWVKSIMQIDAVSRGSTFSVISTTISAATFMASISLALASFIGTWIGNPSNNQLVSKIIYGDTKPSLTPIKYICTLLCFVIAFASFIQCARLYVHVNFLLSMPNTEVPEYCVMDALINAANFWQLGLRSIYFAINLMMWMFGPIPMFVTSVGTVSFLHVLDVNKKPLHSFKRTAVVKGTGVAELVTR